MVPIKLKSLTVGITTRVSKLDLAGLECLPFLEELLLSSTQPPISPGVSVAASACDEPLRDVDLTRQAATLEELDVTCFWDSLV